MSYSFLNSFVNSNISKKKNLIIISSFEGDEFLCSEMWQKFHFRGFVYGKKVSRIYTQIKSVSMGNEYFISAELIDSFNEVLFIKTLNIVEVVNIREDIF